MNKKIYFLLFIIFISTKLFAQSPNTNLLIEKEASVKVLAFLNLIPEGREQEYGFKNRNDFSKIKIEAPYPTYYVHPIAIN